MIYVMSDIHGNSERFNSVMEQINLQPEDTLYILGDVVDRFPDGIRILRKLMGMPNVKMLRGNHEQMMLRTILVPYEQLSGEEQYMNRYFLRLWYHNGGWVTHDYIKHIRKTTRQAVFDYLQKLPLEYDVEVSGVRYKLTHAAPVDLYPRFDRGFRKLEDYVAWVRIPMDYKHEGDYILIHGHTPTFHYHTNSPSEIWKGYKRINIDCGAGYDGDFNEEYRLACLRLDDLKVFYSTP